MSATLIVTAAAAISILGFGLGLIGLVSAGIKREERVFLRTGKVSITRPTDGAASLAARSVIGLRAHRHGAGELPAAAELTVAGRWDAAQPGTQDSAA